MIKRQNDLQKEQTKGKIGKTCGKLIDKKLKIVYSF